jgi:branched-chain amino acid transport system permease protein
VIGGLVATEGLVPHFFQEILGISGNWTLLIGGLILIVTLIQNPEGVAGTAHRKRQVAKRAAAAASGKAASAGPALATGGPTAMVTEP